MTKPNQYPDSCENGDTLDPEILEYYEHPANQLFLVLASKFHEAVVEAYRKRPSSDYDTFEHYFLNGINNASFYLKPSHISDFDLETEAPSQDRSGALVKFDSGFRETTRLWISPQADDPFFDGFESESDVARGINKVVIAIYDELGVKRQLFEVTRGCVKESVFGAGARRKRGKKQPTLPVEVFYYQPHSARVLELRRKQLKELTEDEVIELERLQSDYDLVVGNIIRKIDNTVAGTLDVTQLKLPQKPKST